MIIYISVRYVLCVKGLIGRGKKMTNITVDVRAWYPENVTFRYCNPNLQICDP